MIVEKVDYLYKDVFIDEPTIYLVTEIDKDHDWPIRVIDVMTGDENGFDYNYSRLIELGHKSEFPEFFL